MQTQDVMILHPDEQWFIKKNSAYLNFPKLYYYKVNSLEVNNKEYLVLGGSHNLYAQLPMYIERCEIFEENYMPYRLDGKHFKVRNAALLWSRLNLDSYTDTKNPQVVYVTKNGSFVGKFIFAEEQIHLYELNDESDGDDVQMTDGDAEVIANEQESKNSDNLIDFSKDAAF